MKADEKKYFPMFVDLTQKKVTVIGAGNIAKRRIETLLSFAGTIEVIAPDACEKIKELAKEGRLVWKEKEYDREDLYDADLVLSATNNEKVNNDVYSACKCLGISVNTASNRMKCDFYFPSILQKEETVIGLNSAGNPAKTKNVRKEMQKWIEEAGEKHE
jgi:precorrin-2 dehydrogenase/sirohydrochlorin ferrochelatase